MFTAPPRTGGRAGRYSAKRLEKKLARLEFTALDCLGDILSDGEAKAADRISAAKLTFEIARQQNVRPDPDGEDGLVRVVFEGMPREYAE